MIDAAFPLSPAPITTAAKAMEAVFLRQMIASMRAPVLADDPLGSDSATQFLEMSDARLADSMAGGFGIAALIERQLSGQPQTKERVA